MKMTRVMTPLAIAVAALISAQNAAASMWTDGDYVVRVGASWVDPDNSDRDLRLTEGWLKEDFDIDSDTTWNLSGAWLPVEHWGVELMYISSGNHNMELERVSAGNISVDVHGDKIGRFDASYSNAYLNWYPLSRDCLGQPYVGIGVNYTDFSSEKFSRKFNEDLINSGLTVDGAELGMSHSWGFTGQVGVDFRFGHESAFLVNAAVLYVDTDTDLNVYYQDPQSSNPSVTRRVSVTDVDYSPWIFNLGVGYSF